MKQAYEEIRLILKLTSKPSYTMGLLSNEKKTVAITKTLIKWSSKAFWEFFDGDIMNGRLTRVGHRYLKQLYLKKFLVSMPMVNDLEKTKELIMKSVLNSHNMFYEIGEDEDGPFYGGESLREWMEKRLKLDQIKMFVASTGEDLLFIIYDLNTDETHIFTRSEYEQIKGQLSQIPLTHIH